MSKKYIPGYEPPRHSPRLTLGRMNAWQESITKPGWLEVPRCFGRLLFNPGTGKFLRVQRDGKEFNLENGYKVARQYSRIIEKQIAMQTTIEEAQRLMTMVRTELIRMVSQSSPEDVTAWQEILRDIDTSLAGIHHDSVAQIRQRLQNLYGTPAFHDSIDRPLQSGPAQAQLQAADRRGDDAVEDAIGTRLAMMYYLGVVQEMIREIEMHLGNMEQDLYALSKRSFRNERFSRMRETQAARYCANNILETLRNFFWSSPFMAYRQPLEKLATEIVTLCPRDADDWDSTLWEQVQAKAGQMLTIMNELMIQVEVNHLRQHMADSVVNGAVTPQTEDCMKQIEDRLSHDTGNQDAAYLLRELEDPIKQATDQSLLTCYEIVGKYLDPNPPAGKGDEVAKAATTA